MDGEIQLSTGNTPRTAEEKLEDFTEKLEGFMQAKAVPNPKERDINDYLSMSRIELSGMSAEDLGEIAYEVYAYSYYLQDLINKQTARLHICRHNIEKIVGNKLHEYNGYYGKERMLAATLDHEQAKSFWNLEANIQATVDRLSFMSTRLDNLAKSLLELQTTKRRQYAAS